MSTDNCKKFIEKISLEHHLPLKTSWKRVEKFKENNLVMRKFENKQGDEILISEDGVGNFALVSIDKSLVIPEEIKKNFTSSHMMIELYKLYLNVLTNSPSNRSEQYVNDIDELSVKAIRKYLLLNDDSLLRQELISLKPAQNEELEIGYNLLHFLSSEDNNFVSDTASDAVGVIYDCENQYLHFHEKEGICFFQGICGGDWEMPIQYLVYWSETDKRLKGFFPKGDANIYNIQYNCAYGSEEQISRQSDFSSREAYDKTMNELDSQMNDINENYHTLLEKALNKAFKQMKKIIIEENLNKKMKP